MREWLIGIIQNSNPASVINVILNVATLVVFFWAYRTIMHAKKTVASITTDGNKWLIEQLLRQSYDEHFTRLYQRVDAIATCMGKEFLCNPEHLIPHRGMQDNGKAE